MAPRVGSGGGGGGGAAGLQQRLLHDSAKSLEAKAAALPPTALPAAAPPFKAAAPLQQQQLHAARVHQARLWSAVIAASLAVVGYIIVFLVPPPPRGQRFQWALDGGAGLTFNDWGKVAAMAAAMGAALYALQEAVLRPAFSAFKPAAATEATFFASSLVVRAAFLGTLAARFWGALGGDLAAAAAGQAGGHRLPLIALFLAAYVTDLIQMQRRPREFSASYPKMVVPHHWLSLAWFGAWLVLPLAPRAAAAAPVYDTATLYLSCCVPIHLFKLVTCLYRPRWTPLLVAPVLVAHWAALLGSQAYYNATCGLSQAGCWYPGSIVMLAGGWGMVLYTLDQRFASIVGSGSKYFGTPIAPRDLPQLLFGGRAAGGIAEAGVTAEVVLMQRLKTGDAAAAGLLGGGGGAGRRKKFLFAC